MDGAVLNYCETQYCTYSTFFTMKIVKSFQFICLLATTMFSIVCLSCTMYIHICIINNIDQSTNTMNSRSGCTWHDSQQSFSFEGNSIWIAGKAYCMQDWLAKYVLHCKIFCMLICGFIKVRTEKTENWHNYFGDQSRHVLSQATLLVAFNGNLILPTACCNWFVSEQKRHVEGDLM